MSLICSLTVLYVSAQTNYINRPWDTFCQCVSVVWWRKRGNSIWMMILLFNSSFLFKSKCRQSNWRGTTSPPTQYKKRVVKQSVTSFLSAILFLQNRVDPVSVFGDICVDIGQIWISAVVVSVERNDTDRYPIAHQRTARVTLWGGGILVRSLIIAT